VARVRRRASHPRHLAAALRRLCRHDRAGRLLRVRLRRRRAALPARGAFDRPRRGRRRPRRVPGAGLLRVLSAHAAATRAPDRGPAERAARGRLPAADRAGVRDRRGARGRAVPGRHCRAGRGARVSAGGARGAGSVGARRRDRRGAEPAAPRLQHRRVPGARRGHRAHGSSAARRAAVGAGVVARGGAVLPAAGSAAVARHEVRSGGRRDRRVRRAVDVVGPAADAGRGRGGDRAVLRGAVRGDQRGDLQRADSLRGRERR
jgi:hypothetical protein